MKSITILILIVFCHITSAWAERDTIRLGVSLGLTGKFSSMGDMQQKGYRLWESKVNSGNGILGKKVRIIIKDDHCEMHEVHKIYQDFITKDKVDFIFGPYSSQMTEVAASLAEKYHYPMLAAGAAADKLWQKNNSYIFGLWTPASQYIVGFLEMLVIYKTDNIAILFADDSFSMAIAQGTKDWSQRLGLTIKHFERFVEGTRDLKPHVFRAKSNGAKVLITIGHYNEALDVAMALKSISWKPTFSLATVGATFDKYYGKLGADAEGVCSISIWEPHPKLNFPGAQDFARAFTATYGIRPTYHAATAYAAAEILAQAIEKTDSLDREKVRSILKAMSTYSVIGRYSVDRTGLQLKRFPLCIQWQHGKKEIIWPEELSTAKPIFSN